MRFAPGYRDGKAPYGIWDVKKTYVGDAWTGGQDEDSDVAFAEVAKQGEGIEDVVGGILVVTGRETGATAVTNHRLPQHPRRADHLYEQTDRPQPLPAAHRVPRLRRRHQRQPLGERRRRSSGSSAATRRAGHRRRLVQRRPREEAAVPHKAARKGG